jgi:hypothetical protein
VSWAGAIHSWMLLVVTSPLGASWGQEKMSVLPEHKRCRRCQFPAGSEQAANPRARASESVRLRWGKEGGSALQGEMSLSSKQEMVTRRPGAALNDLQLSSPKEKKLFSNNRQIVAGLPEGKLGSWGRGTAKLKAYCAPVLVITASCLATVVLRQCWPANDFTWAPRDGRLQEEARPT